MRALGTQTGLAAGFYAGEKGRAVVTTAALLKSFCELGNVI